MKKNRGLSWPELTFVVYIFMFHISIGMRISGISLARSSASTVQHLLLGILAVSAVLSIPAYLKRIYIDEIVVVMIFVLLYAITMLNYNTANEISRQNMLKQTFVNSMPTYFIFRFCRNYEKMWKYLKAFSVLTFLIYTVSFFSYNVASVYRTFAAGMLIPMVVFEIEWLYNRRHRYILFVIPSIIMIAIGGRRSSLIVAAVCAIVIFIMKKNYKALIYMAIIGVLFLVFFDDIINRLYEFSLSQGINSRTLRRILSGKMADDSNRFTQYLKVFDVLLSDSRKALFGLGVVGERPYLITELGMKGGYPHGILVEIIGHFGFIIGLFLEFLLFILLPVYGFRRNRENKEMMFLMVFSICMVSELLFQDSYLQNKYFFLYFAVMTTAVWKGNGRLILRRKRIPVRKQSCRT